jgi:hypothetical protein
MTSARTPGKVLTVAVGRWLESAVLTGAVRLIHPAIRVTGCEWEYDNLRHAYRVPIRDLDEVTEAMERAGHAVIPEAARW